jgi:hypothetical protein
MRGEDQPARQLANVERVRRVPSTCRNRNRAKEVDQRFLVGSDSFADNIRAVDPNSASTGVFSVGLE